MQAPQKPTHYGVDNVRRSLKHFALGKGVGGIIGVCWLLLLVRTLSTIDYGIYVGFVAYLELFSLLSNLGLAPISDRFVPEYRARNDEPRLRALIFKLVSLRVLVVCLIAALMATLAQSLAPLLGFGIAPQAFAIFHIVVVAESIARFVETIFESLLLQGRSQVSLFLRTGSRLVLVLITLKLHPGDTLELVHLVVLEAFAYSGGLVITLGLLWRTQSRLRTALNTSVPLLPLLPLLAFAAPIYGAQIVGSLIGVDFIKLLVLRTTGPAAAAIFGFCASVVSMLQRYLPSYLLVGMVRPLIISAASDPAGGPRINRIVSGILKLNAMIIGCAISIFLSIGDQLITLLSGGKFSSGEGYLGILLLFTLSQTLRAIYGHMALAHGQGRAMLFGQLTGVFVLALGALGSLAIGLYGYCVALVVIELVAFKWIQLTLIALGQAPVIPLRSLGKIAVLTALGWTIGTGLESIVPHTWPVAQQVAVTTIAVCLFFLIFGNATRVFTQEEINSVTRLLPKLARD